MADAAKAVREDVEEEAANELARVEHFLNDYEGISGREEFRGDLALMYFASVDAASGDLFQLDMTRLQISISN